MTDAELASIEEWLAHTTLPCGNDVCVGEWGQEWGRVLLNEIRRLRLRLEQHGIDPDSKGGPYEPEPVRRDVWVGGRSDVEARLNND